MVNVLYTWLQICFVNICLVFVTKQCVVANEEDTCVRVCVCVCVCVCVHVCVCACGEYVLYMCCKHVS